MDYEAFFPPPKGWTPVPNQPKEGLNYFNQLKEWNVIEVKERKTSYDIFRFTDGFMKQYNLVDIKALHKAVDDEYSKDHSIGRSKGLAGLIMNRALFAFVGQRYKDYPVQDRRGISFVGGKLMNFVESEAERAETARRE